MTLRKVFKETNMLNKEHLAKVLQVTSAKGITNQAPDANESSLKKSLKKRKRKKKKKDDVFKDEEFSIPANTHGSY